MTPAMDVHSCDEQDLQDMRRLAEGQDVALNDLMERHAPKLHHYLLRSLMDAADAADLAQESFIRVYQNKNRFDPKQKFSTWLYAIASNLVRDRFRWRTRHPQVSLNAEHQDTKTAFMDKLEDSGATPIENIQQAERAHAIQSGIASLPEDLRLPLILAEYEERSQSEIAAILHCTVKAVETRIYRARKQLHEKLEPFLQSL